jgi:heme exporter protein C
MMKHWWKALAAVLLLYTVIAGFMGDVPSMAILNETIRNLYFHVTMWFAMMILLIISLVNSIKYLGAYFLLRASIEDDQKRAKISSVYSIFAFAMMVVFIIVLPRMTDSLHPGKGGNPGFSSYDLDSRLRLVFYPAIIGWTLLGVWLVNLRLRILKLTEITDSK